MKEKSYEEINRKNKKFQYIQDSLPILNDVFQELPITNDGFQ